MTDLTKLPIYKYLHYDIEAIARQIEYECADILLPAPKGIYSINRVEPVMVDHGEYYTLKEENNVAIRTPVHDITELKERIYTLKNGIDTMVIPATFMQNKKRFLSNEPMLPWRGVQVVKTLVEKQLDQYLKYRIEPSAYTVSDEHFNCTRETLAQHREVDNALAIINDIYAPLCDDLLEFIGQYEWHIHYACFKDTKLVIEQSIDYRAYEWLQH